MHCTRDDKLLHTQKQEGKKKTKQKQTPRNYDTVKYKAHTLAMRECQ